MPCAFVISVRLKGHVIDRVCAIQSPKVVSLSLPAPPSSTMVSPRPDHGLGESYSHAPRSRTSSGVSTTEGLFRTLQLADSPATSYAPSPFPLPSEGDLDPAWFDTQQPAVQDTPLLRVDPAETYSRLPTSSPPSSNSQSATMRFVASPSHWQHVSTLTPTTARLPFSTTPRSTWLRDHYSAGQVRNKNARGCPLPGLVPF